MNKPSAKNSIHILDSHTANQIAAGEVVERPFSVAKELVENAIDAKATKIVINVFDAALEKIQVSDNGIGMNPDEMRMSVLRHATSKISKVTDLDGKPLDFTTGRTLARNRGILASNDILHTSALAALRQIKA